MRELISNTANLNIDGLSEPAVKLLDKLSDVLEWNVSSMGAHRMAQVEFINYVRSSDSIPDSMKPALLYNSKKILKEFANQQDVISYGISLLNDIVFVDDIDDEWLYEFMDGAGKASTEELKLIWGKLLASECNEKDSIPKRLLFILKQMDSEIATSFSKLCSTCIRLQDEQGEELYQPIIVGFKPEEGNPITYNDIIELATLGLIEYCAPFNGPYVTDGLAEDSNVYYYDNKYEGLVRDGRLYVGLVLFTKAGESLASLIDVDPISNYVEDYYLPFLEHFQKTIDDLKSLDSISSM